MESCPHFTLIISLIYDLFSKKEKFLRGSAWQRSEWLKDEWMCKIKLKHKSRQEYRNRGTSSKATEVETIKGSLLSPEVSKGLAHNAGRLGALSPPSQEPLPWLSACTEPKTLKGRHKACVMFQPAGRVLVPESQAWFCPRGGRAGLGSFH